MIWIFHPVKALRITYHQRKIRRLRRLAQRQFDALPTRQLRRQAKRKGFTPQEDR